MKTSERIRKAALGPTPKALFSCGVMPADWVGQQLQHDVLDFKQDAKPFFYEQSDATQRTFLLLVAEALETK